MGNNTESPGQTSWWYKLITFLTDNLVALGIIVILTAQGVISANFAIINTQKIYNSDIALKSSLIVIGVILLFAGIIGKYDGFKNYKYFVLVYCILGVAAILTTYFLTYKPTKAILSWGCNKDLKETYLYFRLDNSKLRDIDAKKMSLAILTQKCIGDNYMLADKMSDSNAELSYFKIRSTDEPSTYYEIKYSNFRSLLHIGDAISLELFAVPNEFIENKTKTYNDIQEECGKEMDKAHCHVAVQKYDFDGVATILLDNKSHFDRKQKDSLAILLNN